MKVQFYVNGSKASAAGERAQIFAQAVRGASKEANASVQIFHRPDQKWKGLARFVWAGLRTKPDVVYVVDTAYAGVFAAVFLKALLRCAVIVDTGDCTFDLAQSTGKYTPLQLALIRRTEETALRGADAVVVRGSYHRDLLLRKGVKRVEFIPDGVDSSLFSHCESADPSGANGGGRTRAAYVIGMIGTMSWSSRHQMCYGWDVVEALSYLRDSPVEAMLVGDGDGRKFLEERAKQLDVSDRVTFTGLIPKNDIFSYLKKMDICVSTQSNDVVGWVRTTGKLPLYLAASRFVIATDVGEAHRVLPGVGSLLPYKAVHDLEYPFRLACEVKRLISSPRLLDTANEGPKVVASHFDYAVLAKRAVSLIQELVA